MLLCVCVSSCSRHDTPITGNGVLAAYTDPTYTHKAQQLYNTALHSWVVDTYAEYRSWIGGGQMGVVKWDDLTLCTWFAASYSVWMQKKFQEYAWYHTTTAKQIAVSIVWYTTDSGGGHAINSIYTENGKEYFEPQTGRFVHLSDAEIESIRLDILLN